MKNVYASSAIIVKDNKILLIKRANEPWKGCFATPGGKIEKGETPEQAVVREIKEEVGVDFKITKKLKTYNWIENEFVCESNVFIGTISGKISIDKNEVSDYCWIRPKEALKLNLASTNKQRILDFINLK